MGNNNNVLQIIIRCLIARLMGRTYRLVALQSHGETFYLTESDRVFDPLSWKSWYASTSSFLTSSLRSQLLSNVSNFLDFVQILSWQNDQNTTHSIKTKLNSIFFVVGTSCATCAATGIVVLKIFGLAVSQDSRSCLGHYNNWFYSGISGFADSEFWLFWWEKFEFILIWKSVV